MGLSVTPRRGDALLFCNVDEHGDADPRTIHRACPVSGEHRKFGVNIWLSDGDWSDFALDGNAKKTAKKKKKKKTTTTTKVTTASAAVQRPGRQSRTPEMVVLALACSTIPDWNTDRSRSRGGGGGGGGGAGVGTQKPADRLALQ